MKIINGNKISWKFDETRNRVPSDVRGKLAFILHPDRVHPPDINVLEEVKAVFGREDENVCLKIFFENLRDNETIDDFCWGGPWRVYSRDRTEEIGRMSKLVEATTVQNFCWMSGHAPRVYGIVLIEKNGKHYPAQLVEYVSGEMPETVGWMRDRMDKMEKYLMNDFGCMRAHKELVGWNDFLGGRLIDFQGFRFSPKVQGRVRDFVKRHGKYGKGVYQSVPEIQIGVHPRSTPQRIKEMKLEDIDFEGKTVLDVGCSVGQMCNYASSRGAKKCIGIDNKGSVKAARALSFYLGHHNNDYVAADLSEGGKVHGHYDITFMLSMVAHIDFPEWIYDATKELLIFEENAQKSVYKTDYWMAEFKKRFKSVELIGHTTDHNANYPKAVILARK